MATWDTLVSENFSSGLGALSVDAGNGSVSTSGGALLIQTPGGVDCDWWAYVSPADPNDVAPIAYVNVEALLTGSQPVRITTKFVSHTKVAGNDNTTQGIGVYLDKKNWFYLTHELPTVYPTYVTVAKSVNNVVSSLYAASGYLSTPGWHRIHINPTAQQRWLPELATMIPPGYIYFSTGVETDGVVIWTYRLGYDFTQFLTGAARAAAPGAPLKCGMFLKAWNDASAPQIDATFDNFEVAVLAEVPKLMVPTAGASDDVRIVSGGPADFIHGGGVGLLVQPTSSVEDRSALLNQTAGALRHTEPMMHDGTVSMRGTEWPGGKQPVAAGFDDEVDQQVDPVYRVSGTVQYRPDTLDSQAHPHFNGLRVRQIFYYRTQGEAWSTPTAGNYSGYGRDGFKYTNGVQDAGPVQAPWRVEASSPGGNRSNRPDFPAVALIAMTDTEVVIFDLDSWPTLSPIVWMRFEIGSGSLYTMLARTSGTINDVAMRNGVLVAGGTPTGYENGRLHIINFKATNQNCAHLIGSDGHRWWTSGFDIRDRNSNRWTLTGVPTSLSIDPEYCYSVDIFDGGAGKAWVAVAGEDISPHIIGIEDNIPRWSAVVGGQDRGSGDIGDLRKVLFDENGWFWFSRGPYLFRSVYDYQGGAIVAWKQDRRQPGLQLPVDITAIAQSGNFVYLGTTRGVYKVDKMSMQAWLAFTIVGGGGGGFANNPPDGEILVGGNPAVVDLKGFTIASANILQVSTVAATRKLGGVTTIRVTDDLVLEGRAYPDLPEDAIFSAGTALG